MDFFKIALAVSGLAINSILDLRRKRISLLVTIFYGLLGVGYQIATDKIGGWMVVSLLPGLLALFLAKLTKEKIGYGDGFILLALGCYLNIEEMVLVSMVAVCFAGILALILLVFFHKNRDYAIPFVPFLLCGYVLEVLLWG